MKKIFLILFLVIFCGIISFSQTNTWTGGNANWNTNSNWSLGIVPTAAHDVVINTSSSISVNVTPPNLRSLTITNNSVVTLTSSGGNRLITITNAATGFVINAGSSLTLTGANPGGGTSMGIGFIGASSPSNIIGSLTLGGGGNGSSFNTTNSITNVSGVITNTSTSGIITSSSASLIFLSGGTYIHAYNGGTIPTATWNVASNCNITGITNTAPAGLNQAFGNFTWNCADHTATINLNSALTTVNGNFTINQAGNPNGTRVTDPLVLSSNSNVILNVGGNFTLSNTGVAAWLAITSGTASVILNIGGNFNMSGSTTFFDYNIGTTQNSALNVNVTGNYSQSGGFLDWAFTPTTGTISSELRVGGNFTHSGTALISTSMANTGSTVPNGKIIFNKTGIQTISSSTPTNIGYTNYEISNGSTLRLLSNLYLYNSNTARWGGNFVVKSGGTFDASTLQLQCPQPAGINNVFTLEAGAKVITANNNGLQNGLLGSIYNIISVRDYNSGADYEFQGLTTGTFTTAPTAATARDIIINNTTGNVTLNQPMAVTRNLQLLDGELNTTYTNLITVNAGAAATGYSDASFVVGPILKKGSTDFEFPVGRTNAGLIPIKISNLSSASDFRAEYVRIPASSLGPVTAPGLHHVSYCEYWRLERISGTATANVTMYWNPFSNCSLPANVQNPFSLYVAHFNGASWNVYGRDGFPTGNVSSGTVTWNNVAVFDPAFSPFALGTTEASNIPLKVSLANVKAYQLGNNIQVEWSNLTETDVITYVVEKSADGIEFSTIGQLSPRSNSNDRQEYSLPDYAPIAGTNYYRIRVLEKIGRVTLSKTVKVEIGKSVTDKFTIYPNPVRDKQVSVNINGWEKGQYKIRVFNSSGQQVFARSIAYQGGSMTEVIQLPASIGQGYYSMLISNEKIQRNQSFIVQ